jgi:protein-tyrosine phosphatase
VERPVVVDEWQRRVDLEGCLNFRDLGGYTVRSGNTIRRGLVFRSDALHRVTRHDVARLRALGIGDILDLRSTAELRAEGRGPLAHEAIRFHHVPLFDGDTRGGSAAMSLAERYVLLAEFAKTPIAKVVTTLAHTDAPAVYHCAAGKDRTGVVSAILLALLDTDDETIAGDYALTQENLDAIIDRLNETDGYQTMLAALPPDTLHARPDTILDFLAQLRGKYGSMHGYARAAGVAEGTLDRLAARLLE